MSLIATVGIVGTVVGIYYSVDALVTDISDGGNPFDNFF